jgi:hypothetical protein
MEWHRSSLWPHPSQTNCVPLSWSIHSSSAPLSSSKTVCTSYSLSFTCRRSLRNRLFFLVIYSALHCWSDHFACARICMYVIGIDANANSIEVKIDVAGHSLQVSDNGDGISPADMTRIGARYATSKCSSLEDLHRITTFGFRGEGIHFWRIFCYLP